LERRGGRRRGELSPLSLLPLSTSRERGQATTPRQTKNSDTHSLDPQKYLAAHRLARITLAQIQNIRPREHTAVERATLHPSIKGKKITPPACRDPLSIAATP
jgi:hypothetical protein